MLEFFNTLKTQQMLGKQFFQLLCMHIVEVFPALTIYGIDK